MILLRSGDIEKKLNSTLYFPQNANVIRIAENSTV